MNNIKFVVRVNRRGAVTTQYVQRVDLTPIQMTPDRKLALVMGRFTAESQMGPSGERTIASLLERLSTTSGRSSKPS